MKTSLRFSTQIGHLSYMCCVDYWEISAADATFSVRMKQVELFLLEMVLNEKSFKLSLGISRKSPLSGSSHMLMNSQRQWHLTAWHHLTSFHQVANAICQSSAPSQHCLLFGECLQAHWTPSCSTSLCITATYTLSTLILLRNGTLSWSEPSLIGSGLVPEVMRLPSNCTSWCSETHR